MRMNRRRLVFSSAAALWSGCSPHAESAAALHSVELSIPTYFVRSHSLSSPGPYHSVAISTGWEDELPEGAEAFAIRRDGTIVISDTVRRRLALFDGNGRYIGEYALGFRADLVRESSGSLVVRDAMRQEYFSIGSGGPAPMPLNRIAATEPGFQVHRAGKQWAIITQHSRPVPISVNAHVVAVSPLSADGPGNFFVDVEEDEGHRRGTVRIRRSVHKYSPAGRLLAELPLDSSSLLPITDDVCYHQGQIRQLVLGKNGILLKSWAAGPV